MCGISVKDYNRGLNDAWKLVKKIKLPEKEGGFSMVDLKIMFDTVDIDAILTCFTPQEALAKFEAYEKEQVRVKVGDEVSVVGAAVKGYVLSETKESNERFVVLITNFGDLHTATYSREHLKKTGKHIDIQSILTHVKRKE